jgi:DNA polymerase/3'-5' exonuclease PolX
MRYEDARQLAEEARDTLAPWCERIDIGGSIRRQKSYPNDIELVAIPRQVMSGLFTDTAEVDPGFIAAVNTWPAVKGQPTGKYTQRILPGGMKLDLFMADADNYGSILLIRTGDAAFSKWFMGTLLPRHGYRQRDGYVWRDGVKVSVPEERSMFYLVDMDVLDPTARRVRGLMAKVREP